MFWLKLIPALLLALWLLGVRAEARMEVGDGQSGGRIGWVASDDSSRSVGVDVVEVNLVVTDLEAQVRLSMEAWFPESEWDTAMCIVERESGFDPFAISPTHDYGLFQLNRIHAVSYDWSRILEIDYNVAAAHDLWRTNGWRIWSTRHLCGA